MLDHGNLAILIEKPAETLFQATMMRHAPVNLDPLLLMVTLHFALMIILPAVMRWPAVVLTASAALYCVAHLFDLYTYPRGQIYFNPPGGTGNCWSRLDREPRWSRNDRAMLVPRNEANSHGHEQPL